jgi:hypothetical protein
MITLARSLVNITYVNGIKEYFEVLVNEVMCKAV